MGVGGELLRGVVMAASRELQTARSGPNSFDRHRIRVKRLRGNINLIRPDHGSVIGVGQGEEPGVLLATIDGQVQVGPHIEITDLAVGKSQPERDLIITPPLPSFQQDAGIQCHGWSASVLASSLPSWHWVPASCRDDD